MSFVQVTPQVHVTMISHVQVDIQVTSPELFTVTTQVLLDDHVTAGGGFRALQL